MAEKPSTFVTKKPWLDVTIVTQDEKELYAPKNLLILHSEFCRRNFSAVWKGSTNTVDLTEFSHAAVLEVLKAISLESKLLFSMEQKCQGKINPALLVEVYELADYLAIPPLLDSIRKGVYTHQYMTAAMDQAVKAGLAGLAICWMKNVEKDGHLLLTSISSAAQKSCIFSKADFQEISRYKKGKNLEAFLVQDPQNVKALINIELQDIAKNISSVSPDTTDALEAYLMEACKTNAPAAMEIACRGKLCDSLVSLMRKSTLSDIKKFLCAPPGHIWIAQSQDYGAVEAAAWDLPIFDVATIDYLRDLLLGCPLKLVAGRKRRPSPS